VTTLRPPPKVTITLKLEHEPRLELVGAEGDDFTRLGLWLARYPALIEAVREASERMVPAS
jgi:hypothetical protein